MRMTMAVRKIDGHWYVDLRFDGSRCRKRSPEDSKRGAEAFEAVLRGRIAKGAPLTVVQEQRKPQERRYADYVEEWFETYVRANNKPSEVRKKRNVLDVHILPFFGDMKLGEISTLHTEQFKSYKMVPHGKRKALGSKTINNLLSVLRKSLNSAHDWGFVDKVPQVKNLKSPKPKISVLHKRDAERLLSDELDPVWNLMIILGLKTGMRVGEMMALHWTDVDLDRSEICVRFSLSEKEISSTKNNRIRYIPMTPELYLALSAWKRKRKGRKEDLVFGRDGQPYSRYSSYDALRRICKRAEVRVIGWHTLRHTFATNLCAKGVPIRAVQELLGHSSIIMTERYAHVSGDTLRNAIALLEATQIDFGQYMGSREKQVVANVQSWPTD